MKTCTSCKTSKTLKEFDKDKSKSFGVRNDCKMCRKDKTESYYLQNKESIKSKSSEYYRLNRTKVLNRLKNKKDRYSKNKPKMLAQVNKRRAAKLNATPKWLTASQQQEIKFLYFMSSEINKIAKVHVDHIIPLQGKEVRGLHVPWNLQIVFAEYNLSKSNK